MNRGIILNNTAIIALTASIVIGKCRRSLIFVCPGKALRAHSSQRVSEYKIERCAVEIDVKCSHLQPRRGKAASSDGATAPPAGPVSIRG